MYTRQMLKKKALIKNGNGTNANRGKVEQRKARTLLIRQKAKSTEQNAKRVVERIEGQLLAEKNKLLKENELLTKRPKANRRKRMLLAQSAQRKLKFLFDLYPETKACVKQMQKVIEMRTDPKSRYRDSPEMRFGGYQYWYDELAVMNMYLGKPGRPERLMISEVRALFMERSAERMKKITHGA